MGPAPSYFDTITSDLEKNKALSITKRKTAPGYNDTIVYKSLKDPDMSVFSQKEIQMLKRITDLYGGKSGTELEKLSHSEAPYMAVEDGEEIPLELSFYRGTDFS